MLLTLTEAAARLGVAASTLRHQVQAGRLRARLIGKTYVVTEREVERYRREHLGKPGRPSHRPAPPSSR
jgi:excisionase family DNA binding protein